MPRSLKRFGYNWAAVMVELARNDNINVITSYTKHGEGTGVTQTILEANSYLGQVTVPYVWGADLNKEPQHFFEQ
eukprot:6078068-Karenia_brevis.AAC.1